MAKVPSKVPIAQSALLVIDAQASFTADGPRWARRSNHDFEKNVAALIEAYRAARLPIFFILHTDDDPEFQAGHPLFRPMDFITVRKGEKVIVKQTRNCFTSTPLLPLLLEKGVRRLAITGIQTEQCCETTTRVGKDLGFDLDFVTEATLTFPIANSDEPGKELGVDAIVERTEYALRGRFARIATVKQLTAELAEVRCPAAA